MNNKILVTGSAGFIGYHLSKALLLDGFDIIGIDNLNDYYDNKLKKDRLGQLSNFKNFKFEKIDISNRMELEAFFLKFKIDKVVNLAAQPGVRYSIENPYAYMDSNLVGFLNVILFIYLIRSFEHISRREMWEARLTGIEIKVEIDIGIELKVGIEIEIETELEIVIEIDIDI